MRWLRYAPEQLAAVGHGGINGQTEKENSEAAEDIEQ